MIDKRKHPRVDVSVVVSYDCYNDDGEIFEHGIGVALDVSIGGLLIETNNLIDANFVKVIFVNYDNRVLDIVGSVVHSRKSETDMTKTGICFHAKESESTKFVTNLIRTHNYNKKIAPQKNTPGDIPSHFQPD